MSEAYWFLTFVGFGGMVFLICAGIAIIVGAKK